MTEPLDRSTAARKRHAAAGSAASAPTDFAPTDFAPTARPGTLQRPGGTLAYDEQGEGPLAILVPGLGDLRQEYRYLAPRLAAAGYRVVTLDLRGHGGSSVGWPSYAAAAFEDDLAALVAHLGGGPAVIVGNSFAADPAARLAANRPELVSKLVLVGAFVRPAKVGLVMRVLMRLLFTGPWKVRAWAWYYGTLFPGRKPDDFVAYRRALAANLAEPGRFAAVRALIFRNEASASAELGRIAAPTLAMMGSKDPDFPNPAAEADWIAARTRGETALIEGAGHYPFSERPGVTAERILEFLGAPATLGGRNEASGGRDTAAGRRDGAPASREDASGRGHDASGAEADGRPAGARG